MTLMTVIEHSRIEQSDKHTLENLWQTYEKKQIRNKRYQAKLDGFYDEFTAQMREKEQEMCDAMVQWVRHLFTFITRKSIKGSQREMLYDWIQEDLAAIEANPFNHINTSELRDEFNNQIDAYQKKLPQQTADHSELELFRQEVERISGIRLDLDDEALNKLCDDPEQFEAYFEQLLREQMNEAFTEENPFNFDDTDFADSDFEDSWDDAEDEFYWQAPPQPEQALSIELFNDKSITKLYRQLANQFHPDKEADPAQKTIKKELMQRLSKAKKSKDSIALLMLAIEYLPKYKLDADEKMLKGIEAALQVKINLLNQEYQAMSGGRDIKSEIWQRFGRGSKTSRAKGLVEYADKLAIERREILEKCHKIKTVKEIQQELAVRQREMLFSFSFDFSTFDAQKFAKEWQ
ncbi:MAG: J domain-containing protein [Vibrionaceae bacterium]